MQVSYQAAETLRGIKSFLKEKVKRSEEETDFKRVYEKVVNKLKIYADKGEDIGIARNVCGRIPHSFIERENNRNRFTPEMIEEVAFNEFARGIYHNNLLVEYLYFGLRNNQSLDTMAEGILDHWGTPLEAVD
jgi:hypothetical protein